MGLLGTQTAAAQGIRIDTGPAASLPTESRSCAEELAAGTHPRGMVTRYLAEGAQNAFFDTRLALLNYGSTPAHVLLHRRGLDLGGLPPVLPLSHV